VRTLLTDVGHVMHETIQLEPALFARTAAPLPSLQHVVLLWHTIKQRVRVLQLQDSSKEADPTTGE
jgi:hypothetical protein